MDTQLSCQPFYAFGEGPYEATPSNSRNSDDELDEFVRTIATTECTQSSAGSRLVAPSGNKSHTVAFAVGRSTNTMSSSGGVLSLDNGSSHASSMAFEEEKDVRAGHKRSMSHCSRSSRLADAGTEVRLWLRCIEPILFRPREKIVFQGGKSKSIKADLEGPVTVERRSSHFVPLAFVIAVILIIGVLACKILYTFEPQLASVFW